MSEAIIAAITSMPDCEDINNSQLAAISSLDLSSERIRLLQGGDFDGLTGLTSLDLSSNTLLRLPADIFTDLDRLTKLRMNNNLLSSLPTGIFDNLTNLTDLNLASNFLSSLSADIFSDLAALETLRLNDNDLFSLPSGIFDNLTNLKNLHLNDNSLSSLPNGIFNNLTMLINLDLSLNGLSSLSVNTFSDLTGLNVLHLNDNFLSTLDENIFNSLTTLSLLNLSNNFLSTLHKNIFSNLDSLMELQLSFNDLSALPKEIFANLANLQNLSLSINQIDELIPDTFDNLTNLNALYLDNNDLSILPPEIFSGLPLEALFLSYNHLNELPSDIFHGISNLRALGVDSNDGDPGSPFELLLTLVRTGQENHESGPATVSLRIAEGAPFTMTVPIMISNGDVNNLNLTINAGDTESSSITLSQNKISENTVMTISQIPSIPEDFSGIRLVADDALRLFPVIPVAPTNVIVTPGNQHLRVSWTAPSNNSNNPITGYTVTAVGAGQTHQCTADAQTNFCVITGLRNGIEYTVQVVASNDNGNSEPSIPVTSAPTDISVCGRTSQVVTAIMEASDDIACTDVTAVHLARIGELDISSSEVTVLQNGDFDGLTSLFRLDLSGNLLSTLPATIFNGLTNLRSLSLADNDLISLPPNVFAGLSNLDALDLSDNPNEGGEYTFTLTLVRTDETNLARGPATVSLQIAEGAPFTMTVPIITSNTESVSDVSLTIAAGNAESDVLTVIHQMDSTEHANLRLGTLPSIPSGFKGIQLVAGTALQLFPAVPGIPTDVVTTVFGVSQARVSWTAPDDDGGSPITGYRADVVIAGQSQTYSCIANGAHRTACTTMTLPIGSYSVRVVAINAVGESNPSIPAIGTFTNVGFQAGLCERTPQVRYAISAQTVDACNGGFRLLRLVGGITHLDLSGDNSGSEITSLMSGDFDGLARLTELDLSDNSLTTLPETIFNSLIDLEVLDLSGNEFNTLPANIFYDLINLRVLRLDANNINTLPATIFSGLDSLETLLLNGNDLMTLPMNIFAGFTNLQTLNMADNPDTGDNYMFNLTLSRVDGANYAPSPASLSLQIAEGAPTALTFPIIVTGTATVTDNAGNNITELTLTAGLSESDMFHVTSAGNVAVGLDSAMLMLPTSFTGVQFVVSNTLLLFSTVCDRTAEVADAIVAAVSAATSCDEVTDAQLAKITTLDIMGISSLQTGDFDGLTNLDYLDLSSGSLSELPANIFAGLTNLQTLLLNNNNLVALPPNIFAGLINLQDFSIDNNPGDDKFRLELTLNRTDAPDEAPGPAILELELVEGAPTTITAQILVNGTPVSTGGAITVTNPDGSPAMELTLLVGSIVSTTIQVSNTGSDKVTVTLGTLTTPTSTVERGIEFVSDALELFPTSVCDRTMEVRDVIVATVSDAMTCNDVTTDHLAEITTLDLSSTGISSLQTGDFDNLIELQTLNLASSGLNDLPEDIFRNLTALTDLDLSSNTFSILPPNIFADLTNLLTLDLSSNAFSTLSETIFSDLTNLQTLRLNNNALETLPTNIFAGLTNLLTLDLSSNTFNTLSATIFFDLTNLQTLLLNDNNLVTLPTNIFAGLTNLQILNMANNPDDDYMFNLSLNRVDGANYAASPASLSLQIAEGAPTALTFPIRVVTGTATVTDGAGNDIDELTLAAGRFESNEFHVISTDVVAVGLDSAVLPTSFTGVQFVVSDVLFLFSTVCDRTAEVADAIVALVPVATCDEVAAEHLARITTLDLSGISSLQTDDFAGLTNLVSLDLSSGSLSELPTNIFADLTNLETLLLNNNDLMTLPPNIFAGLTGLNMLNLIDNPSSSDRYTFTLELTRTDGPDDAPSSATVSLRLNEGAPTTLSFLLAESNPYHYHI